MRSRRAMCSWGYVPQDVPVRMAFPQPSWAACPSTQAVSPNNSFSLMFGWNFPSCCLCCPFIGESVSCPSPLLPSGSGVQQLNPFSHLSKPSPASLPSCILCSAPVKPQVLPDCSPLWQGHSHAGGPRLVTAGQTRLWSLCCPWGLGLLVSSQSVRGLPFEIWGVVCAYRWV